MYPNQEFWVENLPSGSPVHPDAAKPTASTMPKVNNWIVIAGCESRIDVIIYMDCYLTCSAALAEPAKFLFCF
jgi:hypothetical protein